MCSNEEAIYRGQLMSTEEFNKKIRHKIGGFFSVASFFSTTRNETLAKVYAGADSDSTQESNMESIVFKIEIDNSVFKFPYANIASISQFETQESEILFTMGSFFRIKSIDQRSGLWKVHLKLTNDEDQELKKLTYHME